MFIPPPYLLFTNIVRILHNRKILKNSFCIIMFHRSIEWLNYISSHICLPDDFSLSSINKTDGPIVYNKGAIHNVSNYKQIYLQSF